MKPPEQITTSTPAHTDAVEIARQCICEMRERVLTGRLCPDSVIAALIEPKLRERDERLAELEAEIHNANYEHGISARSAWGKESYLRAQLAAEQHRYSELHVTCTALESEANALRADIAAAREDGLAVKQFLNTLNERRKIYDAQWHDPKRDDLGMTKDQAWGYYLGCLREVESIIDIYAARQTHEEGKG